MNTPPHPSGVGGVLTLLSAEPQETQQDKMGEQFCMSQIRVFGVGTPKLGVSTSSSGGTPIAVSIANQLGLPPEPFVLAVLFGANMSFATPMAYQTNLLVMNAGNYSFGDFVRVGLPLVVIMWALLSFLLPWLYGM